MNVRDALRARNPRFAAAESLWPMTAMALVVAGLVYDAFFDVHDGPITCPLLRVTGVQCPTCGMTRSFVALGNGDIGLAFAVHPLGPVLALFLVATFAAWVARVIANRPPSAAAWVRQAWWGLCGILLLYGAVRAFWPELL